MDVKYTELEKRQINDIIHIIKSKYRDPSIRDIDPISKDILDKVYNDERLHTIYDKKKMTIAALKRLFVKNSTQSPLVPTTVTPKEMPSPMLSGQDTGRSVSIEHLKLIKAHEPTIDTIVNEHTDKMLREKEDRQSACCLSAKPRKKWCCIL